MSVPEDWTPDKENLCTFILDDNSGTEVPGLGTAWTLEISIAGGPLAPGLGSKGEIGSGWYWYLTTAQEAASATPGPRSIVVNHALIRQQNLEYTVEPRVPGAVEVQYTVNNSVDAQPVAGVKGWFTANPLSSDAPFWLGYSDFAGVFRDGSNNLPRIDTGVSYFWKHLAGYTDDQNPDVVDTATGTVFSGTMTPVPDGAGAGPVGAVRPFHAYANPDDFQKYWFMDFGDGEHYEQLWPLLRMASSRVTSALAATDQLDCPRSDWANDYLKELVVIIAGVMFNSPAVRLSNEQREIYSRYTVEALRQLREGEVQVCQGATGKMYPAYEEARYGLTERNTARVAAQERLRV